MSHRRKSPSPLILVGRGEVQKGQQLVLSGLDVDRVLDETELELEELHALGDGQRRQGIGVELILDGIELGDRADGRRGVDVQARDVHELLELALEHQDQVLGHDDVLDAVGHTRLGADDLDLGRVSGPYDALSALELLDGEVVLLLGDLELAPGSRELPIDAVDAGELVDDGEARGGL